MLRTRIDGAEVAWTDSGGGGYPLLLIHGGGLADWMTPLAGAAALRDRRTIRMVRAGATGASVPDGLAVADHARHAAVLLRQLDAEPADVVAHSSGATIALQLAVDHPAAVRSLVLLEPPLVDPLIDPADLDDVHAAFGPVLGSAMAAVDRGDNAAAFDAFMALVCGPDFRTVMNDVLGAELVDAAAAGSRDFFTSEVPALGGWTFDPAVTQSVLLVQGAESPPPVHRLVANVARQLKDSTIVTVDGVNHMMPLTAPEELGRIIADFSRDGTANGGRTVGGGRTADGALTTSEALTTSGGPTTSGGRTAVV